MVNDPDIIHVQLWVCVVIVILQFKLWWVQSTRILFTF